MFTFFSGLCQSPWLFDPQRIRQTRFGGRKILRDAGIAGLALIAETAAYLTSRESSRQAFNGN